MLSWLQLQIAQISLPDDVRPENLPAIKGGTIEEQASKLVGDFVLTAIQFAGALAIIFIIIAGFRYVISVGDDEQMGKAKSGLIWAVVALLILILSYAIVSTVFDLLVSVAN
ncbi:hypothetical protein COV81_02745 [Candidatus Peregrinibacteria bacterium CG11_big_fil_rev_8_21_14_0_20_41_10]|nr:MAG: hypothetical protein COV81_02745 [Candidatus Peregrinibacteria bacterium CG11_big_fil_rev_8_21_14_0_20_41_10]PIZ76574.1 MAG: hypothetical protein COY06_01750 [Candidatus Peregrinibacteria bacterium CG_4_10_14_0_2_um_filter_41_8]PJC37660.1 MAG: hypothetical protein CO045_04160 [Candidatus Peregrinibacteria bacterium CG_4_9_14_0_2_um_filter_41_14]